MIPSDAIKPLDKRTKEFENYSLKFKNSKTTIPYSEHNSVDKIISNYVAEYGVSPMYSAFTPYRICPLGAHVDHNLGKITGFAINKGIHIVYNSNTNGVIELESLQFNKKVQWHILNTPPKKRK